MTYKIKSSSLSLSFAFSLLSSLLLLYKYHFYISLPSLTIAIIGIVILVRILYESNGKERILYSLVIVMGTLVGVHLFYQSLGHYEKYLHMAFHEKIYVEGRIEGIPKEVTYYDKDYYKIPLEVTRIKHIKNHTWGEERSLESHIIVYLEKNQLPGGVLWGSTMALEGIVKPYGLYWEKSELDLVGYRIDQGLVGTMFKPRLIDYDEEKSSYLERKMTAIRYYIHEGLSRYMETKASDFLEGLLFGADYAKLDPLINKSFADTGLIHILSVSGSHITVIVSILVFLLRFIGLQRKKALLYAMAGIVFYAFLVGPSPPVIRATTLGIIGSIGVIQGRNYMPLVALTIVMALNILWEPLSVNYISFQYSYGACYGILLFYQSLQERWEKWPFHIGSLLALTISAQIFVIPLQIEYFHMISLSTFIANVMVGPLLELVVSTGILLLIGEFFYSLLVESLYVVSSCLTLFQWIPNIVKALGDYLISISFDCLLFVVKIALFFTITLSKWTYSTVHVLPLNGIELSLYVISIYFFRKALFFKISQIYFLLSNLVGVFLIVFLNYTNNDGVIHFLNGHRISAILITMPTTSSYLIVNNDGMERGFISDGDRRRIEQFVGHYTKCKPNVLYTNLDILHGQSEKNESDRRHENRLPYRAIEKSFTSYDKKSRITIEGIIKDKGFQEVRLMKDKSILHICNGQKEEKTLKLKGTYNGPIKGGIIPSLVIK